MFRRAERHYGTRFSRVGRDIRLNAVESVLAKKKKKEMKDN